MYTIERTNSFKKAFKRCVKRGLDISLFETAINILVETGTLPKNIGHISLAGNIGNYGNVIFLRIGY